MEQVKPASVQESDSWTTCSQRPPCSIRLTLSCMGDLDVDGHHTSEDCALALGRQSIKSRKKIGIQRFGFAFCPLDEALTSCCRSFRTTGSCCFLGLRRGKWGNGNRGHHSCFQSLAIAMRASLHVDCLRGENDHHRCESAFKACALALRQLLHRQTTIRFKHKGVL